MFANRTSFAIIDPVPHFCTTDRDALCVLVDHRGCIAFTILLTGRFRAIRLWVYDDVSHVVISVASVLEVIFKRTSPFFRMIFENRQPITCPTIDEAM